MQEYKFDCGGKELAKVLCYYGLMPESASTEQKIICPFHNDIAPSMSLDFGAGRFFCFGCQESGDAFQFVRKMNKDKNDLQAGLEYFKILKSNKVKRVDLTGRVKKKKEDKQAYDEAHDYYYGLSKVDWYKPKSEEVVETKEYMKHRGFKAKTLNMSGAKVTYNYSYPIVFPMLDNGVFHGWVCRTDKPNVEAKRKYLYNEGFSRRNTLVGTYGNKDYVIVVEGYMDRLKMIQNMESLGISEDVVAILGWRMTNEQIAKLKNAGVNYVISALDNDKCGRQGTDFLRTKFGVTRFCYLKGYKDPGEMSKSVFLKMYQKTLNKLAQDRRKR